MDGIKPNCRNKATFSNFSDEIKAGVNVNLSEILVSLKIG